MDKAIRSVETSYTIRTQIENMHLVIDWMLMSSEIGRVSIKTVRRDTAVPNSKHTLVIENLTHRASESLQVYINERI